jgi:hypothetical protein
MDGLVEPASDFADRATWELGLTGQRMETAKATEWLDDDDRELLSLWFLVEAGLLTRAGQAPRTGYGASDSYVTSVNAAEVILTGVMGSGADLVELAVDLVWVLGVSRGAYRRTQMISFRIWAGSRWSASNVRTAG